VTRANPDGVRDGFHLCVCFAGRDPLHKSSLVHRFCLTPFPQLELSGYSASEVVQAECVGSGGASVPDGVRPAHSDDDAGTFRFLTSQDSRNVVQFGFPARLWRSYKEVLN
jgi:hypothetical protein